MHACRPTRGSPVLTAKLILILGLLLYNFGSQEKGVKC